MSEIAEWVPPAVRVMAEVYAVSTENCAYRLLTDDRMRDVWEQLRASWVNDKFYRELDPALYERLPERDEPWGATDGDLACAALFRAILTEINQPFYLIRTDMLKGAKEWERVALWCRSIYQVDGKPLHDAELASALELVASHFERLASDFPKKTGPRILGRNAKGKFETYEETRHENERRTKVGSVIDFCDKLYKTKHRKLLADLCSIALAPAKSISCSEIDDWRDGLNRNKST